MQDSDATSRQTTPLPAARKARRIVLAGVSAGAIVGMLIGAWLIMRPELEPPRAEPPPQAILPDVALPQTIRTAPDAAIPGHTFPAEPPFVIASSGEAEIAANRAEHLTVFRFAPNPRVLILDFPALREQGMMLNRIAALIEKRGQPHDRVLSGADLEAAIRASGDTVETYYYGHDYRAADLAAFFALADRDHVPLNAQEERLRVLVAQEGWFTPGTVGALISIPREGADPTVDARFRRTILHHELAHGEYFTNPAYAAYARRFFHDTMRPAERAAFRGFLIAQDYDVAIDDLVVNEAQAYLMHTTDRRAFNATVLGLSERDLSLLQAQFLFGMAPGWLRDCTSAPVGPPLVTPAPDRRFVPAPAGQTKTLTAHLLNAQRSRPRQRPTTETGSTRTAGRRPSRVAASSAAVRSRR